ncbi:MAG TPA: TolC family protein [Clostridia bacterium]|nr:TolC family protein [Clostridia bacterium]
MKKLCLIISVILCVVLLFNSIAAFADAEDDGILTLEEAKALALKNDVQFNLQQSYIQQASESYEEVYDNNTKTDNTNYNSLADRASAAVSRKVSIESAASSSRRAVFERNDLKRASDYNVTEAFYGVIEAKYSLMDAEAEMELKRKDLEIAKIKYGLSIITKNSLSQVESAVTSSQTAYNKTFSELQNSMSKLSKNIGKNLDVFNDKLDMTLNVPDIKSLDLNKIKVDYMKNNSSYYSAKEQYDLAEYKLQLTEEQYDYYYKRLPNRTSTIVEQFDEMLSKAKRDFADAKYSFSEKEKDLDVTLNSQYTSINNLYESYETQKKEIEDTKLTIEQNRIKYQMGLITKAVLESSAASLNKLVNQLNATIINLNTQYMNMTQYSLD